eukprot:GHVN01001545.1.p1 GENE.GHVN01001545.1~~GHVN01001545.1.p1  ORF type:complete len:139 (-),score=26.80 GHVN01001545.1:721-1137(-)
MRQTMEDVFVVIDGFERFTCDIDNSEHDKLDSGSSTQKFYSFFVGVYDGHGGKRTVDFLRSSLHKEIYAFVESDGSHADNKNIYPNPKYLVELASGDLGYQLSNSNSSELPTAEGLRVCEGIVKAFEICDKRLIMDCE